MSVSGFNKLYGVEFCGPLNYVTFYDCVMFTCTPAASTGGVQVETTLLTCVLGIGPHLKPCLAPTSYVPLPLKFFLSTPCKHTEIQRSEVYLH